MPAAWLTFEALAGRLGANPIEEVLHRTGWWALALLMISLAVTPIRRITGWNRVIRYRRLLGLFAFAWATAHFLGYLVLDQWFAWPYIVEDIAERPFILVGFSAWLLLLPLAVTSTTGWIRRLGKRWRTLHRVVYVAVALGTLHFYWKVKADTSEPLLFIGILAVLLLLRIPNVRRRASFLREARRNEESGGRNHARRREDRIPAPGP
jgi:sulfoxide reductase heme-binding subunit YedZ